MPGATDLLREDHNNVKDLFRQFEEADDARTRRAIADEAIKELEVHSQIEEEIFYPAVRKQRDASGEMDATMNEADEEHHVADLLIAELKRMRGADEKFIAKFTVLAENVKHHIGEEEAEIFTKAAEDGGQYLQDLGEQMLQRKMQLMNSYGKRSSTKKSATKKSARKKAAAPRKAVKKAKTAATKKTAAAKKSTRSTARKVAKKVAATRTRATTGARKAVTKSARAVKKVARRAKTVARR
jgi:hemerythrin-like domain-containing protein